MGLAIIKPSSDQSVTAKELVQWADKALYESKETGRNKVHGYDLNEKLSKLKLAG